MDFEYEETEDGLKITKYIGTDATVYIPDNIDGVPVTTIGSYAFKDV